MTYVELRKSTADVTSKIQEYTSNYHSVSIEAQGDLIKVIVWKAEAGNRKPIAMTCRKCIGDCFNDIDKQIG